ncbi:hypothetical protein ABE237_21470 [Brevibacillus formosus]|uniref:hypothetical protein n=1 Tax=Brevibacillus formosus TaxID=54913 RepID=UPI0018CD031D|nr:hypothetical protein [Brevibacillus formosus]MBG9941026.1 hypothetical protein [Brevibacillus formosus]
MSNYYYVDLTSYLNNRGFTTDRDYYRGFLSLGESSLPEEQVNFDKVYFCNDVPFRLCKNENFDNMATEGQRIDFPVLKVKKIHFLGVSNNGDLFDFLYFMFNSTCAYRTKLCFSDFISSEPAFGDQIAINFTYMNTRSGRLDHYKPNIWYYPITLEKNAEINGIEFEDNPSMHVFAITIETE